MKQNLFFSSPAIRFFNAFWKETKRPPPASGAVLFVNSRMVPGDNKSYVSKVCKISKVKVEHGKMVKIVKHPIYI